MKQQPQVKSIKKATPSWDVFKSKEKGSKHCTVEPPMYLLNWKLRPLAGCWCNSSWISVTVNTRFLSNFSPATTHLQTTMSLKAGKGSSCARLVGPDWAAGSSSGWARSRPAGGPPPRPWPLTARRPPAQSGRTGRAWDISPASSLSHSPCQWEPAQEGWKVRSHEDTRTSIAGRFYLLGNVQWLGWCGQNLE